MTTLDTREAVARTITQALVGQISHGDVKGVTTQLESDVGGAGGDRARDQPTVVGIVGRTGDLGVNGSSSGITDNDQGRTSVNDTLRGLPKETPLKEAS